MKKEKKNYTGLFLKILGISFLVLTSIMVLVLLFIPNLEIPPDTLLSEIIRIFMLGLYGVLFLSMFLFFVLVIYSQFKDKRIIWGIINTIALIIYFGSYLYDKEVSESGILAFIILIISCLWYYFKHIKPKFRKKK